MILGGPARSLLMAFVRFAIVLSLRVVRFLKEQLNMMFLQESEKVYPILDVEQNTRC